MFCYFHFVSILRTECASRTAWRVFLCQFNSADNFEFICKN